MAAIDKVRVLVVGDSGVGKTSLTHLIANNEPLTSPGWTVGCAVEVKLHEYKEGTTSQNTFFVELWDVGGSISHKNTRGVFYNPTHGIILVHDLTNRKSHENLQRWLAEILNKDGKDAMKGSDMIDIDPEQFLGSTQIPILVIGTKLDLLDDNHKHKAFKTSAGSIAEQCGADEICLNCHEARSLAAGTTDAVKLSRFFDKVIERKYYNRDTGRKYTSVYASALSAPFTSFGVPVLSNTNTTSLFNQGQPESAT
ncbi:rab-like protein 3 isoform X2 [Toxorhynchites rutilus septentrionalis]|uniref:rab-like protein 3 isoform X2 n=1 Tax=Toxorhynchites rutilus septentrionalis TaxID=329112 RepID=UPI0024790F3B|nr:rab-like protein 3 isoform X2 [Toxorhynchites rutilus septentrionalis]